MQIEWVDSEIKGFQNAIRNTEDTVEIQLDLLRNRILRFELVLSIISAVLGFGAVITGALGMNLLSGYEEHPSMFWMVSGTTGFVMFIMILGSMLYGIRKNLL